MIEPAHHDGSFGRTRFEFDQACAGGDAEGCHELSACYTDGRGVAADPQKGQAFARRAKRLGFSPLAR